MGCKYKFCKYDATKFIIGLDKDIFEVIFFLCTIYYRIVYVITARMASKIKLISFIDTAIKMVRTRYIVYYWGASVVLLSTWSFCFRHHNIATYIHITTQLSTG